MTGWETMLRQAAFKIYRSGKSRLGINRLGIESRGTYPDRFTRRSLARSLGMLGLTGFCCLLSSAPALANTNHQWQLTSQSPDGLAQQYIDLNSMRSHGSPERHQWVVDSYFVDRRFNQNVRADYVTVYDCDRNLYKDINNDGIPAAEWGDAQADPFNRATMTYVCQYLGY